MQEALKWKRIMVIYAGNLRIGVLGGIGPEATGLYYLGVIRGLQQTGLIKNNAHFPYMIIHSIPAPELVGAISPEQLEPYKCALREIDGLNVSAIVMVCNTVHLYLEELQKGIRAPIMDLRQRVKERIFREGVKKIAVLGTPSTIKNGLYRFEGIEYEDLSDQDVEQLSKAILRYNKGEDKLAQQQIVEKIARKCLDNGAEKILLACTEFAVMFEDANIPKINTLDILVEGTIDLYKKIK